MNQNQTIPPAAQQPMPQTPAPRKKRNMTRILIFLLIFFASSITAMAYFYPKPEDQADLVKQNREFYAVTSRTPTPTPIVIPWTTYSSNEQGYLFHYPQTWKLDLDKSNPDKFVLRESGGSQGEIQGEFLPEVQFNKIARLTCQPIEQNPCFILNKAASSSAYVFPTMDINTQQISSAKAYITRPDGTGFYFNITKSNTSSYNVFLDLIVTLRFSNEKRISPLPICPDSWSADRKTLTYRGVTFPASEVDEKWIQANCK